MKNLFFLLFSVIVLSSPDAKAQSQLSTAPIATVVVKDTIHYFFNKHYFKTAAILDSFPFYKSPAASNTLVTHVGSLFKNNEPLDIYGLQSFASRNKWAVFPVPVHLYLCNADNLGMPQMPPLDSVVASVSNTVMTLIGGALAHGIKRITGDYYVLIRNFSVNDGDTANLLRTAGRTFTSGASPKYISGDGYGVVRDRGKFFSATNYTAAGFGYSTDYEICIAPMVQYTLDIGHDKPWETNMDDSLICAFEQIVFKSTCSKRISHRQYNLIEFRRHWDHNPPFHPNTTNNLPTDSSGITWHFLPEDHRNYHLPANSSNGQIIFYTDSIGYKPDGTTPDTVCFEGNEFRVRHFGLNLLGGKLKYNTIETFNLCTTWCGYVGLAENLLMADVKAYPNPVLDGRLTVNGLKSESNIVAYNLFGQQVFKTRSDKPDVDLDLANMPQGIYLLKINNSQGNKTIKIIRQ